MNNKNNTGKGATHANPVRARWYGVRHELKWTLALSAGAWLGLFGHEATRGWVLEKFSTLAQPAAQLAAQHPALTVNALALLAVGAAVAEGVRSSRLPRAIRKIRRRIGRLLKATQMTARHAHGAA